MSVPGTDGGLTSVSVITRERRCARTDLGQTTGPADDSSKGKGRNIINGEVIIQRNCGIVPVNPAVLNRLGAAGTSLDDDARLGGVGADICHIPNRGIISTSGISKAKSSSALAEGIDSSLNAQRALLDLNIGYSVVSEEAQLAVATVLDKGAGTADVTPVARSRA